MALLDYLLGGAAGGFQGYEAKKAKDLQAQKDEEDRQIKQLAMLNQLGFRATGPVRETPDEAARNIVGDIQEAAPMPKFDSTLNRAFGAAQQRDFGVAEKPTGALTTPVSLALDSSKIGQFERAKGMQPAGPEMQVNTPLGRMGFTRETPEQKKAKEDAAFEQSIAGFSQEEKRIARLARVLPSNVLQAITQPKEGRQPRLQLTQEGQIINLDTKEVYNVPGFKKTPKEPRSQPEKSMPEGSRKRLEGYESGIFMVRDAIGMLNEQPQAVGPLKGRVWRAALDAYDKAGVGVRAYLENLSGEIRNQRFGGALTATEAKFAESMLPSDKDLAENAITKLVQLERYLEQKRKALYKINKMEYEPVFPSEAPAQKTNPYR
jgi:hypothetical protein